MESRTALGSYCTVSGLYRIAWEKHFSVNEDKICASSVALIQDQTKKLFFFFFLRERPIFLFEGPIVIQLPSNA